MILPQKGLAANASHGNMAVKHIYITRKSRRLGGHMTREELDGLFLCYLHRFPTETDVKWHLSKEKTLFEKEIIGCPERLSIVNLEKKGVKYSDLDDRVPLYFNYSGSRRDLLDRAIESYDKLAGDLLDIRVHYAHTPRKFTRCLNEILKINEKPYFFAHYDSVLESRSAVENIINLYKSRSLGLSFGVIGHCRIVDLFMLVVPEVVRLVNGWDEAFHNSWMDMDMYFRMYAIGLGVHVMHNDVEWGYGVDHKSHSSIRSCPVVKKVYTETMIKDCDLFHSRHGSFNSESYRFNRGYIKRTFGV